MSVPSTAPSSFRTTSLPSAVWAAHATDAPPFELVRMDPTTGTRAVRVAIDAPSSEDPKFVLVTPEAVWVASEQAWLHRVDPSTARVVAKIEVGNQLGRPASCAGSVWLPSGRDGGVIARVDPRSNSVTGTVRLAYPREVVTAADTLWVSHGPRVTRIDPRTLRTIETFDLGAYVLALAPDGNGAVWAATLDEVPPGAGRGARESGALVRLAPGMTEVTPLARIEGRATGVCVGAGAVWVAAASLGRFDPSQGAVESVLEEAVLAPVAVGERVWARRYDYDRDADEIIAFDPATGVLDVLDPDGRPVDLAVG